MNIKTDPLSDTDKREPTHLNGDSSRGFENQYNSNSKKEKAKKSSDTFQDSKDTRSREGFQEDFKSHNILINENENLNLLQSDYHSAKNKHILPTSMRLLHPILSLGCYQCAPDSISCLNENPNTELEDATKSLNMNQERNGIQNKFQENFLNSGNVSQCLIAQYISYCHMYTSPVRVNPGILTALRFSLPNIQISSDFHDADMLAFADLMLPHINTHLKFIKRLDFSIVSKHGKVNGKKGFTSHGAYALAKVLQISKNIKEVYFQRNKIGFYGATAIFTACGNNPNIHVLSARRCSVGERGAAAFTKYCINSSTCGLREVDLSANRIGFVGCKLIEAALSKRREFFNIQGTKNLDDNAHMIKPHLEVELEANLILQEVMNSVTHGLGIIICLIGSNLLMYRVREKSFTHIFSCSIYSASLLVLYTSSTLYHSFFSLLNIRYLFEIFDHCAIYILIAGSYTPYLSIALHHKPIWSVYLLTFIWLCCVMGNVVEGFFAKWKLKSIFSLTMYLAMGWCCVICIPDLLQVLPQGALNYLIMGGVAYTSGVPFFVRNNNLDHSIWHCFVLAGSIFHWLGVYLYVAPIELISEDALEQVTNSTVESIHDGFIIDLDL